MQSMHATGVTSRVEAWIDKPHASTTAPRKTRRTTSRQTPTRDRTNRTSGCRVLRLPRPQPPRFRKGHRIAKRALDLTICLLALPLLLPLMALCAALVWLDDGRPILLAQSRTGRAGKRFRMYKFRTMVRNAEGLKEQYRHLNELSWPDFKIKDDPRMTRVGRWLRKTSLDELPQFFNVLQGNMSLVGPRPTSFDASTYLLWQTERLEVAPGITGYWQINGRSDIDFDVRSRLDIEYIERQSLWLDIQILFKTVPAILSRRGAS